MDTQNDYVQAQLKRRAEEGQVIKVAAATGLSLRTIYYVMEGKPVKKSTLMKLRDYLKANARKKTL